MKRQVHILDLERVDRDPNYHGHYEEREFPDEFANRHSDLCIMCGMSVYPSCREWCPNEKTARGEAGT